MEKNFDVWLARRQNRLDEGWLDWLWGKKKPEPTPPSRPDPAAPEDVSADIDHPLVKKYTNIVLGHLGIPNGASAYQIRGGKTEPTPTPITWPNYNPSFYKALQRFVAAHVMGQGANKSYLRISQHDAIIIINQLDSLALGPDQDSLADEYHVDDPEALTNWMQAKVPTAPDAMRQQGFQTANSEFMSTRIGKGRGDPRRHPGVQSLVSAGSEVIKQASGAIVQKRSVQSRVSQSLYTSLQNLDAELRRITRGGTPTLSPPPEDPARPPAGPGPGAGGSGSAGGGDADDDDATVVRTGTPPDASGGSGGGGGGGSGTGGGGDPTDPIMAHVESSARRNCTIDGCPGKGMRGKVHARAVFADQAEARAALAAASPPGPGTATVT